MKDSSPYIIPFYIPQKGCVNHCIYCNAFVSTHGEHYEISKKYFTDRIESYLSTKAKHVVEVQVAFYGGSFNFLGKKEREYFYNLLKPYLESGVVNGTRISARPDNFDESFLGDLARFRTRVVELGIQTMNDDVLEFIRRGHGSDDVLRAFNELKKIGIAISAHVMIGLPGENKERFFESFAKIVELKPRYMRIHPTLVLKGTELEELYRTKNYIPISLEDAVEICSKAYEKAKDNGVTVLRMGLQANESLDILGGLVAGPYHPSFGELVLSNAIFEKLVELFGKKGFKGKKRIEVRVNPSNVSKVIGNRRSNMIKLKNLFLFDDIRIVKDPELGPGDILVN